MLMISNVDKIASY